MYLISPVNVRLEGLFQRSLNCNQGVSSHQSSISSRGPSLPVISSQTLSSRISRSICEEEYQQEGKPPDDNGDQSDCAVKVAAYCVSQRDDEFSPVSVVVLDLYAQC